MKEISYRYTNTGVFPVRDIAKSNDTYISRIQQDIKCGLAFIKSRYPHFKIDKFI